MEKTVDEKISKLTKAGIDESMAIARYWEEYKKRFTTFKKCREFIKKRICPSDDIIEEVKDIMLAEAKTFEDYFWLLEECWSSYSRDDLWEKLKEKTKTFKQGQGVWQMLSKKGTGEGSPFFHDRDYANKRRYIKTLLLKRAKSADKKVWALGNLGLSESEKEKILAFLESQ